MPPTSGWTPRWPGHANTRATCGACTAITNACNGLAAPARRRSSANSWIYSGGARTCRSWHRAHGQPAHHRRRKAIESFCHRIGETSFGMMIFDDYIWSMEEMGKQDMFNMPKMAIDAFVNVFTRKAVVVRGAPVYQLYVTKIDS